MTVDDYIEAGFKISAHIDAEELARAETDAADCYVQKIYEFDGPTAVEKPAIMQIAVILLAQRRVAATRSGGKAKLSPSLSETALPTQQDFDNADRLLRYVQETRGDEATQGNISEIVDDIAGIYYRKKFLGL